MPSAAVPNPRAGPAAPDDRDNAFNYDQDVDDFLRNLPINDETPNNNTTAEPVKDVDEEITVKKKRAPVAKLDETRLLSDAGVPKLRRIAKTKLKFKGKGHEFSDISRLLNTYQLWLDDLYPKAKFRDGLKIVEKLGHSKRMQISRRAWMDETKLSRRMESPERVGVVEASGALGQRGDGEVRRANDDDGDMFGKNASEGAVDNTSRSLRQDDNTPEDDELVALMTESAPVASAGRGQHAKPRTLFEEDDDEPDEDELDALMAGSAVVLTMAAGGTQKQSRTPFDEDDGDTDEDELDALMAENPR